MHKTAGQKALAAVQRSKKGAKRSRNGRKVGRNKVKCANYRVRIGKPNGPGQPGNKAGKNKTR